MGKVDPNKILVAHEIMHGIHDGNRDDEAVNNIGRLLVSKLKFLFMI